MARPKKRGLDYFPLDTDFFWDDRIFTITDRYGPRGPLVYLALLCEIYREGYYLEIPAETVAGMVMRRAGVRCFKDRNEVMEIIDYCVLVGLFHRELFEQGVITSEAIQRRYAEVTARRRSSGREYWLLPEKASKEQHEGESSPSFSLPENEVNVCNNPTNKRKQNQTKQNQTKQKQSKVNQTKQNHTGADAPAGADDGVMVMSHEVDERGLEGAMESFAQVKTLTAADKLRIIDWCGQYGARMVRLAAEETHRLGGKSLAYAEKVLTSMAGAGAGAGMIRSQPCSEDVILDEEYVAQLMSDDGWGFS